MNVLSRNTMEWRSEAFDEERLARDWNAFELEGKEYIQIRLHVTVKAPVMGYMGYYVDGTIVSPYDCHKSMTPLTYTASEQRVDIFQDKVVTLKYSGHGVLGFPPKSSNFTLGQLAERRAAGGLRMAAQFLPVLRQAVQWEAMWAQRLPRLREEVSARFRGENPDLQDLVLGKMREDWLSESH